MSRRLIGALAVGGALLAFASGAFAVTAGPPTIVVLSDEQTVSQWANPVSTAVIRATPSVHSRHVGNLHYLTEDGQYEVYLALRQETDPVSGRTWIQIRVPGRPNGRLGWVPKSALGPLHTVDGYLLIDREALRARLFDKDGNVRWSAPVGVGRASLPTPAGHFYLREKLRAIGGPVYGPFALGTSAYAPSLTDWPGGGVVGIHGTDQPGLIPGRPSHGCVRLRNGDVTSLWNKISVGTPIEIR